MLQVPTLTRRATHVTCFLLNGFYQHVALDEAALINNSSSTNVNFEHRNVIAA